MITVGNKSLKFLNKDYIVSMHLSKGKPTAYAKGTSDERGVNIDKFYVREPWSLVIQTVKQTEYLNCKDFEEALGFLVDYLEQLNSADFPKVKDKEEFKESMREHYGQQKTKI